MRIAGRRTRTTKEERQRAAWEIPVTLRIACAHDRPALLRLAQLDSRPLPAGPFLVAIREGRLDAAISLTTEEVVADPFRHTAELCGLLRIHAGPVFARSKEDPVRKLQPRPAVAAT